MDRTSIVIAIDFDETIAVRDKDLVPTGFMPKAKETLKWLKDNGCTIVIWTCRSGDKEDLAKKFLDENGVKYDAINDNVKKDMDFETSRKIYADVYVDDKNISFVNSKKVDWDVVKQEMEKYIKSYKKKSNIRRIASEILSSRGMDEAVQKMYDGKDRNHKRYDQLSILDDEDGGVDKEQLASELGLEEALTVRRLQDKEESDYVLINPDYSTMKAPHYRDETQKYKNVDEPLNNEMYWGKTKEWK